MIKAIIFDFFGVLTTRGLKQFKSQYFRGDPAKIAQGKSLQAKLDSGGIGYDDFIDELARIAGSDRQTVLKYTENYAPNKQLLNYIERFLKPKYKLGIISNSGADWVNRIIGEQSKLFDDIILSYKSGHIKPESKIYQLSATNLNVKPDECIFIDDIMTYCSGAESIGMKSIWYRNFDQFKTELKKILSAVSDN